MLFTEFNNINRTEAAVMLQKCCGSERWLGEVMKAFPYSDTESFIAAANEAWYKTCGESDWLEAFLHHPEIGDINSLQDKFNKLKDLAEKEQSGVSTAGTETLENLLEANREYREKFGFIFIVFATGRSADEMLALLKSRLGNSREDELKIAMGEQQKITMKRLNDIVDDLKLTVSQITTHILDTSSGMPAQGVAIRLMSNTNGEAETIAQGITNADGRIPDLLPAGRVLAAGIYTMRFESGEYFQKSNFNTFFPFVEITFNIVDSSHYHIPLLISPFGYTTYRGS